MKLILVRGWPGSGKSTYVNNRIGFEQLLNGLVFHYEADMYFERPDGTYDFNPRLIKSAHEWCFMETASRLADGHEVYVSNTFSRKWEIQPYIDMANEYEVQYVIVRCDGNYQNIHGVPDEKVQQMKERMEDIEGEIYSHELVLVE